MDFTVKEMSLDFSKVKTAAFSLLQKRSQLFSLNANNALLEFLLEGTPQVKEQLVDSRKEVDKQLKHSCEEFIKYCTGLLVGPLNSFLEKVLYFILRGVDVSAAMFYNQLSLFLTPTSCYT